MAQDFRIQLRLPNQVSQGDIIEVKAKIKHPSFTGLALNEDAQNPYERFTRDVPSEFVKLVEVFYGDEQVSTFEMNSTSSNDPLLGFKLRADKAAAVRVVVTNHRGDTVEATADVQFS
jgi:sulfur-oxidizing protein SoxZ